MEKGLQKKTDPALNPDMAAYCPRELRLISSSL